MAHDHTFDCRVCGAHLDSQRDLDDHTRAEHDNTRTAASRDPQPNRSARPDQNAQADRNPRNDDPRTPNTQERL